ncbi:MAG: transposase [Peptostreptococcaceae bacterium]|nr:transposase [Peptostreptococcaceae bacterium]
MAKTFVSLEEAARLENLSYKGMTSKIQRNPEEYHIKNEAGKSGGKDRVLIELSSLSKNARRRYKESLKVDVQKLLDSKSPEEQEIPWYVTVDVNWYVENYKKAYYEAIEYSKYIKEFLECPKRTSRLELAKILAEEAGVGMRTFQRHVQEYLEASIWAMRMQQQDQKNYDFFMILALCRKPREKDTFPSLSERVRAYIENIWFHKAFAANRGTVEMLYGKLGELSQEYGFEYPSYWTVNRYIQHLMNEKRAKNAHFLAAHGEREYKNRVMVKGRRNTKQAKVMEYLQGDEHTFDCWVAYTNPSNGKVQAIRPTLVAWIDTKSRMVLGDVICKKANADILKQSLLKVIYGEQGGVPRYLIIDNGKDYTAEEMTGRNRKDRSGLYPDADTKGFYKSLGIEDDYRTLPYQPWGKGQIERFFGSVCEGFTKWLESYTGTLTGSKTVGKVKKDIQKMLDSGNLLTLDEFYAHWKKWLHEQYEVKKHHGLKLQKEKYLTPKEVFENEERYYKAAPPKEYAAMLMMKSERVYVYNIGIRKFGQEYRSQELTAYIGEKVDIRWDLEDITKIYVYTTEGTFIGEALSQELLLIAPRVSQKALEEHLRMQNKQIQEDRKRLEEYTTPFEQRVQQHEQAKTAAGLENLLLQGKATEEEKIVSLPQDKQYAQMMKQKKKAKPVENDFLRQQGEQALKKLRAMNG